MSKIRTNENASNNNKNEIKIRKCNSRHEIMKKILEFHFQICIVFDVNIEQSDPFIKKTKNEIRVKIERVF